MKANSLTMYLPVRPRLSVSENKITNFKSMDCEKREEHYRNLEEIRRIEAMKASSSVWNELLGFESCDIDNHKIKLVDGESVVLKTKSGNVSGQFNARACKVRLERIFLVDRCVATVVSTARTSRSF